MGNRRAGELWGDESGFIVSTDLVLISSILVIGMLVGLVSLRDQVVQELGDVAVAVGNLNQSYSFGAVTVAFGGYTFTVAGSEFADASDFCEIGTGEENTSVGIQVNVAAESEG
jgi:hypothetical protein